MPLLLFNSGMKTCIKCHIPKPDEQFYTHPKMTDGRLNKCKDCCRSAAAKRVRRMSKDPKWVDAERERCRKKMAASRAAGTATPTSNAIKSRWRKRNRVKSRAHCRANRAVNTGRLKRPERCEECGSKSSRLHKHHDDYNKPLEVEWLCPPCHGRRHRKKGTK